MVDLSFILHLNGIILTSPNLSQLEDLEWRDIRMCTCGEVVLTTKDELMGVSPKFIEQTVNKKTLQFFVLNFMLTLETRLWSLKFYHYKGISQ